MKALFFLPSRISDDSNSQRDSLWSGHHLVRQVDEHFISVHPFKRDHCNGLILVILYTEKTACMPTNDLPY